MSVRIKPREINREELAEILALKRSDITATKLKDLFAVRPGQSQARFQPNDQMTLMPNQYYNKVTLHTTVGRYIYNLFCLPIPYLKKFEYCNDEMTEDNIGGLEKRMGLMILEDQLTTKEYAEYMDNSEWIGMSLTYFIVPSLTKGVVIPIPEVMEEKEKLFAQYKKELDAGDLNAVNIVEKKLLSMAEKKCDEMDDPAYDLFKSGVFSFKNNYKKCSIMIGAINDPKDGKLRVLKSDYTDGVDKNEYDATAVLTVIGGTARGVCTQKYGYETKKYNASLQNVSVDITNNELDCGTDRYLTITIPKEVKTMFYYRFILENGKLVELTPDILDNYVGKTVKMRSPMFCKNECICERCAGTLYKRMDLREVGSGISNMTGNLLNLSMKKMHDSTVKIDKINLEKFITEK